jgi:hypothetical protein
MAEATKLFDKSSGTASGDKQDAVNGAAMTIMKLLVQSKLGSGDPTVGGKDSGGLSGLLSLVRCCNSSASDDRLMCSRRLPSSRSNHGNAATGLISSRRAMPQNTNVHYGKT